MELKTKPSYSIRQNIGYILKNIWRWNKKLFFLSTARIPPLVLLPLLAILMPKIVIDCLTKKVEPETLALDVGLITLGIVVCSILNQYLEGWLSWNTVPNRTRYVCLINQKILDTDYENLESPEAQKKLGKATQANRNNSSGTEAIVNALVLLTANLLGFLLYGGILSALNPMIVVLLLITATVSFFVSNHVQSYEHKNKDNWTLLDRKLWYLMKKCSDFAAGKDIRLYGMTNWFMNLFKLLLNNRVVWLKRVEGRRYLSNLVDGLLILIRDGLAYTYLIYLVLSSRISVADFTLYFGAVTGFSTWMSGITDQLTQINHMSLEICDVRDYLDLPDQFNRSKGVSLPNIEELPCMVEFEHVSFQYAGSDKKVLEDFNLKIHCGEKIALVGMNGAGKTTCIKLLCGFYHPTSGRILVNGKDMLAYNRDEYYKLFTAVFQDIHMLPVSIVRNIAPVNCSEVDNAKVLKCLKLAGLEEKVSRLPRGIESPLVKEVNEDAVQLSGGELQKLLLARALYKDAPVLILDEPTAALDPIAENELYQRYGELTTDRTSIFISHRLSSTRFCDRIVFLAQGKIAECGTHDELMKKKGKYAEMFEIQSHYYKDNVEKTELVGDLYEKF